ncbi:hypothetical protein [Liquorilactobacillus vini]|uniref:hypothetical protein n=1 Tax=Liquorilactobacillus vini TaxID=238015 RepID=UPI00029A015D|nr:hypothetical protein [Liquorilactobacillus vini]
MKKINRIYIICPYVKTGGPRSLHQLCNSLTKLGYDAGIVYGFKGVLLKKDRPLFSNFCGKVFTKIDDEPFNMVITSESDTVWHLIFKNVKKVIWWLSLDYYYQQNLWFACNMWIKNKGRNRLLIPFLFAKKKLELLNSKQDRRYIRNKKEFDEVFHLYNCEYVRQFLLKKKVSKERMAYLCGPITFDDILDAKKVIYNKKDIVCYNPAKMNNKLFDEVKKSVLKKSANIKFIKIEKMSHSKVAEYLLSSKLYVDFGFFPGPERMPREAVLYFNNLIVSDKGSAHNEIDYPIPQSNKINLSKKNIEFISKTIVKNLSEYKTKWSQFKKFQNKVLNQKEIFDLNIINFLENIK